MPPPLPDIQERLRQHVRCSRKALLCATLSVTYSFYGNTVAATLAQLEARAWLKRALELEGVSH